MNKYTMTAVAKAGCVQVRAGEDGGNERQDLQRKVRRLHFSHL